jgi:hypothetical protein
MTMEVEVAIGYGHGRWGSVFISLTEEEKHCLHDEMAMICLLKKMKFICPDDSISFVHVMYTNEEENEG